MSVRRESAMQLIRERFHLDADTDEKLLPLTIAEVRINHVRSLEVTVPLEVGNTTDVAFTQSVQFTDSTRTNALLFPPLNKTGTSLSGISVHFHSNEHAVGKSSLTVVDEARTFASIIDRSWCSVKSTVSGSVLAQGYIMDRTGKTITIGGYGEERTVFAWPSTRILLCYEKPPIDYGVSASSVYVLVQTEHPMDAKEDIRLYYSLETTLNADMQYNIAILAGTDVCTFDTTYTIRNSSLDVTFDDITTLHIVDRTQYQQTSLTYVRERSVPMMAQSPTLSYRDSSSSSSSSSINSLIRPVDFTYNQTISIGPDQSVELFNGEPTVIPCLLSYRSDELQPYLQNTSTVSTVLWFQTASLSSLITRGAKTKVAVTHIDMKTTLSSFYWNREDDDAKYVHSGKEWLPKVLTSSISSIRIENDSVEESSTGKLLRFHVISFLHEDTVIAFPVFPNQIEGRCLSVELVDKHNEVHDQPWAVSALPQLYAIFILSAEKRLNFIARFSLNS